MFVSLVPSVANMFQYLLIFDTVLKDILNYQAPCFSKSNFMPHPSQSFVNFGHDLWGFATPTQFEELLPDMACVSMDHCFRDPA